jgi:hypothetical protein
MRPLLQLIYRLLLCLLTLLVLSSVTTYIVWTLVSSCDFHHIDGDLLLVLLSIGPTWGIHLHGAPLSSLHLIIDGDLWLGESHFSLVGWRWAFVWVFLVFGSLLHSCISLVDGALGLEVMVLMLWLMVVRCSLVL